jgi:hypothetical protein
VVHARKLENDILTFIVSGKLWRNSLIMQDKETGSLWSHITGKSLDGAMKGKQLDYLPSVQSTWNDWVEQHPDTKVLRKEKEVRSSSYENYFKDPDRIGIFRSRWLTDRMPGKNLVHGINVGIHALAIEDVKLKSGQLLNVQIGETPAVAVRLPDGGIRAYIARAGDRTLHFRIKDKLPFTLDMETESTWDLESGVCTAGKLKGTSLEETVVRTAFWFAWSNFFPNTKVAD